jgi:hypothetical protein
MYQIKKYFFLVKKKNFIYSLYLENIFLKSFYMRNKKAYNSVGRVPVLQTGCHRFESGWAYKKNYKIFKN